MYAVYVYAVGALRPGPCFFIHSITSRTRLSSPRRPATESTVVATCALGISSFASLSWSNTSNTRRQLGPLPRYWSASFSSLLRNEANFPDATSAAAAAATASAVAVSTPAETRVTCVGAGRSDRRPARGADDARRTLGRRDVP